jgi:hypothetical protein
MGQPEDYIIEDENTTINKQLRRLENLRKYLDIDKKI